MSAACLAQYENLAGAYTCGARILWLMDTNGLHVDAARNQVAGEFPSDCGECFYRSPTAPPSPSTPPPPQPPACPSPSSPFPPPLLPPPAPVTVESCRAAFVTVGPSGGSLTPAGCAALALVVRRALDNLDQDDVEPGFTIQASTPPTCTLAISAFDDASTCSGYANAISVYCVALVACLNAPASPPPQSPHQLAVGALPPAAVATRRPPLPPTPLPPPPAPPGPLAPRPRFPWPVPPPHCPWPWLPPLPPFDPLGAGEAIEHSPVRILTFTLTAAGDVSSLDLPALRATLAARLGCHAPCELRTVAALPGSVVLLIEVRIPLELPRGAPGAAATAEAARAAAIEAAVNELAATAPAALSDALSSLSSSGATLSIEAIGATVGARTEPLPVLVAPPPPISPSPKPLPPPPPAPPSAAIAHGGGSGGGAPAPPSTVSTAPPPPATLSPVYPLGEPSTPAFFLGVLMGLGGLAAFGVAAAVVALLLVRTRRRRRKVTPAARAAYSAAAVHARTDAPLAAPSERAAADARATRTSTSAASKRYAAPAEPAAPVTFTATEPFSPGPSM